MQQVHYLLLVKDRPPGFSQQLQYIVPHRLRVSLKGLAVGELAKQRSTTGAGRSDGGDRRDVSYMLRPEAGERASDSSAVQLKDPRGFFRA